MHRIVVKYHVAQRNSVSKKRIINSTKLSIDHRVTPLTTYRGMADPAGILEKSGT